MSFFGVSIEKFACGLLMILPQIILFTNKKIGIVGVLTICNKDRLNNYLVFLAFEIYLSIFLINFFIEFANHFEEGKYYCIVCNDHLFDSTDKYLKEGYTAFNDAGKYVIHVEDDLYLTQKARCELCGSYLGNIYEKWDVGYEYHINSASLYFKPRTFKGDDLNKFLFTYVNKPEGNF